MKYSLILLGLLMFVACGDGLEKRVISANPDGTPAVVEYYKWVGNRQVVEKQIRYYINGNKQEEGGYLNGERNGKWTYWHDNGNKWSEGFYTEGQRNGTSTVWYKSGEIQFSGFYTNDTTDGEWVFYDGEGNKLKEVVYKAGEKISEVNFDKE